MKVINEHIKTKEYKNIYLLYGAESYLVQQYKNKLREAIVGEDTMNYAYFEGRKIDTVQLIDTCNTLPFFAEKRLIIIEDSGFFKSANNELNEYIKSIPDYLVIVFVESEIDKRSRLFKLIGENGYACELKIQDEATLTRWIVDMLGKAGKKVSRAALTLLLDKCGTEMSNIHGEVEKLICYIGEREAVEVEDVDAICTTLTVGKVFDMVDAISARKQKEALDLYYDLLLTKEPAMRIMFLIARHFNELLKVKELAARNMNNAQIEEKTGIQKRFIGKYLAQARGFTIDGLKEAIRDMTELDEAVKFGNMKDDMAVELIIIKYSRKETA